MTDQPAASNRANVSTGSDAERAIFADLVATQQENARLQVALEAERQTVANLQEDLQDVTGNMHAFEEAWIQSQQTVADLQRQVDGWQNQASIYMKDLDQEMNRAVAAEDQVETLQQTVAERDKEIKELRNANASLRVSVENLRSLLAGQAQREQA